MSNAGESRQQPGALTEPAITYGEHLRPGERSPAPYAASAIPSRGRRHPEPECNTRSPFQRDRDRILHSTSFRRLIHKTQVFVYHEGDHYRTRLTHSLEVAQIARTIARQLRLDEDLAEALALAHDLGHPPFGHAGERALDAAMEGAGGFDHNAQSLRVVLQLERKYRGFDGLNLTWETIDGLARHNGPLTGEHAAAVVETLRALAGWDRLDFASWGSAEAQVAALADDIAYVTHDIDDGLRADLVTLDDLAALPMSGEIVTGAADGLGPADRSRVVYEVTRRMITRMIADLVDESRRRLAALAPVSPDDIRRAERAAIAFSEPTAQAIAALKAFLLARVYRSPRVSRIVAGAEEIVRDLFARYSAHPDDLPPGWQETFRAAPEPLRPRVVADFVAGMTDRYAIREHRRLFDATPDLR